MPEFAANLSMLFTELPFLDRFAAAAEANTLHDDGVRLRVKPRRRSHLECRIKAAPAAGSPQGSRRRKCKVAEGEGFEPPVDLRPR